MAIARDTLTARGFPSRLRNWPAADPALHRVRAARRRYWAAREAGDAGEIETALREWVDAQLDAAASELGGRDLLDGPS